MKPRSMDTNKDKPSKPNLLAQATRYPWIPFIFMLCVINGSTRLLDYFSKPNMRSLRMAGQFYGLALIFISIMVAINAMGVIRRRNVRNEKGDASE